MDSYELLRLQQKQVRKDGDTMTGDLRMDGSVVIGNVQGNADTSTRLQNLRNIKIGNTTKQFDGSQDLEWTLAEIGAGAPGGGNFLPISGGVMTGDINMGGNSVIGNLQGNADTAATLQTPRKINDTEFNGSQDITTVKWGESRNITIGNAVKPVDGSQDIDWDLNDIGAAPINHNQSSNTIDSLAGYNKGNQNGPLLPTDSLNDALAKIENNIDAIPKLNLQNGAGVLSIEMLNGNNAQGEDSAAFGLNTTASGNSSFSCGNNTTAEGGASHAEGHTTRAIGPSSHAEGWDTTAQGDNSHAEGSQTTASGGSAHAEGSETTASGDDSHAEGHKTEATAGAAHAEGWETKATGGSAHAEGYLTHATADNAHAEGAETRATKASAHAEGFLTESNGNASHAEGIGTTADADASHAEGNGTTARGDSSHAEGHSTTASGASSHAEGYLTTASGDNAHAEGWETQAIGVSSHASGRGTVARGGCQVAIGVSNNISGDANDFGGHRDAFIIGNGAADGSHRANGFRVTFEGTTYGNGAFNTWGADYAEYFEWSDGNKNNEDRRGHFVTFDKGTNTIRKATSHDNFILGAVSTQAAIIGDCREEWKGKYKRDKWGNLIYETLTMDAVYRDRLNPDGSITKVLVSDRLQQEVPIISENFDENIEYISREKRAEWSPIGLLGKLLVYSDGTCKVGDFCKPNDEGIATKADNGYYVLEVRDDNIIKILIK